MKDVENIITEKLKLPAKKTFYVNKMDIPNQKGQIYKITNKINNKVYIGQTTKYKRINGEIKHADYLYRYNCHKKCAFGETVHKNAAPKLYAAMRKYGEDNFSVELIEEVEYEIVDEREIYWIDHYDAVEEGYNVAYGGKGCNTNRGKKFSEEVKLSMMKAANTEIVRENRSKAKPKNSDLPPNIMLRSRNGGYTGYRVNIKIMGVAYEKCFSSSKISMEEKLEQAKEWLHNLKMEHLEEYREKHMPK